MIGLLVRLARFVVLVLLVRFVLRALFGGVGQPRGAGAKPPASPAVEDLVKDPVCNTHLPRSRALRATLSGRDEYFCSAACRDRALSRAS